jgi:hypothetical protein
MRAPIAMEKHLGQRPPRISESNFRGLKYFSPPPQTSDSSKISQSTEPPDYVSETQTIGRAPIQYAGATNGESLWALPTQQSPEASSDSNSVVGQSSLPVTGSGMDDLMADIDWVSSHFSPKYSFADQSLGRIRHIISAYPIPQFRLST